MLTAAQRKRNSGSGSERAITSTLLFCVKRKRGKEEERKTEREEERKTEREEEEEKKTEREEETKTGRPIYFIPLFLLSKRGKIKSTVMLHLLFLLCLLCLFIFLASCLPFPVKDRRDKGRERNDRGRRHSSGLWSRSSKLKGRKQTEAFQYSALWRGEEIRSQRWTQRGAELSRVPPRGSRVGPWAVRCQAWVTRSVMCINDRATAARLKSHPEQGKNENKRGQDRERGRHREVGGAIVSREIQRTHT